MKGVFKCFSVIVSESRYSNCACSCCPFSNSLPSFRAVVSRVSLFVLLLREDVDVKIGRRLSKFLRQWHCRPCPRGKDETASVPQDGRPEAGPCFACCGAPVSPPILAGQPHCSRIPCTLGAANAPSSRRTGTRRHHARLCPRLNLRCSPVLVAARRPAISSAAAAASSTAAAAAAALAVARGG